MNIAEIAKMAGVSSASVSRYFNNGYISEQKRDAIRRVVEETGYRPSVQAQTLRTKKTKMVGVIMPKIESAAIGKVVKGILDVLDKNGYQALLAVTQNDPKKELEYLAAFHQKQVDGVILIATVLTPEHKHMLKNSSVPVVIVGQYLPGCCCVFHDDYQAMYDLTKLFLEKGRKKLGYISAVSQDRAIGEERYRGFCDAMRDMGGEEITGSFVADEFTVESGYKKAGELLEKCAGLDGLICATDEMAVGARRYLREHDVPVPEQILVAGQGDTEMASVTIPPLITIHYHYEKSGELAVRMLMKQLENKEGIVKEIRLGYYIVE